MSHITNDSQREMNARMDSCLAHQTRQEWDFNTQSYTEVGGHPCGPWVTFSPAQDRCTQCGLIYTY